MGLFKNFSTSSFLNTMKLTPKENKNKLQYFLPWSIFVGRPSEGIVFLKSGGLMQCYEFVMPDMDSVDDSFLNSVSVSVNSALCHFDESWAIHFEAQRSLTTEYPGSTFDNIGAYLIDAKREENFELSGEHFVNRYVLTIVRKIKNDIYSKATKVLYKNDDSKGQDYYSWAECEKEIERFRGGVKEILSYINLAVHMKLLDNDECTAYLHSACSTQPYAPKAPNPPQFFDAFITDCDYVGGTTIKIGDYFCPIIGLKMYPSVTWPNMLSTITTCNIELRWTTRYIGMSRENAHKELERYQKRYHGAQKSWKTAIVEVAADIESTLEDPVAGSDEADVMDAMQEVGMDAVTLGFYTCNIMVWDKDLNIAQQKAQYIIGLINQSGFGAKAETINNFQAWLGMMPGNVTDNLRRPIMTSGNVSQIIPLSSMWQGNMINKHTERFFGCSSPLLVCGTHSGSPFFYNQNVQDVGHGFIFGPTGAGKSTMLCLLESQFLKYKDANVIILDKDKSARGITMACGGICLEPGKEDVAFQPLRELETEADIRWCSDFIELLLIEQKLEVTPQIKKCILNTLREMRKTKSVENRTISTFQQYVKYSNPETGDNDVQIALEPYTINGQYGAVFDADHTDIALTRWLMIEMGSLMKMSEPAVTPALMFIFHYIEKIYAPEGKPTTKPTLLVLDESWVFLDNEFFRKRIEDWLLTLRKFHVFVVFATQEVARVARSQLATTIISQCHTMVYLADPKADSPAIIDYYRTFNLSDSEISTIAAGRKKRDYLFKSDEGVRQFQLDLDDFQLALIAPKVQTMDMLDKKYGVNTGEPLATQLLDAENIDYSRFL